MWVENSCKLLVLARTDHLTAESDYTHKFTLETVLGAQNNNGNIGRDAPKQKKVILSNQ